MCVCVCVRARVARVLILACVRQVVCVCVRVRVCVARVLILARVRQVQEQQWAGVERKGVENRLFDEYKSLLEISKGGLMGGDCRQRLALQLSQHGSIARQC